ncbi:hypothetical protein AB1484_29260 [Parafrankia sp. FMc6]|uniref:hypothetical protein n=1 Tax=Parafrankia soli TaxID=2599596 RepID=UPI0034D3BB97
MDPTVLGAIVTGVATVLVAALGLGATRQAARRAADLETLRAVIAELRAELTRERADYAADTERLRARIRELESP